MKTAVTMGIDPELILKIKENVAHKKNNGITLREALYMTFRGLIRAKELMPQTKLPPSRILATRLCISRETVEIVYGRLECEGYVCRAVGRGSYVSWENQILINHVDELSDTNQNFYSEKTNTVLGLRGKWLNDMVSLPPYLQNSLLTPSLPDPDVFPLEQWLQIQKKVMNKMGRNALGYGDPQGLFELREIISDYFQQERGIKASANQIIIVNSTQQAFSLCSQVLFEPGNLIATEDPSYPGVDCALINAGMSIFPVHVDVEGINVEQIVRADKKIHGVFVTPSHHYPLGVSLNIKRRFMLIEWARRHGAWIIEDDYDSEFHYHGVATMALQGLDNYCRTVYLGTFSKTLVPGIRIGFMIVPEHLVKSFVSAKQLSDGFTSVMTQLTLFKFIYDGFYRTHVLRMNKLYKARMEILYNALQENLSEWITPNIPSGGLQVLCRLKNSQKESELINAAHKEGIGAYPLSLLCHHRNDLHGFFLGFAAYKPDQITQAVRRLKMCFSVFER